MLVIVSVDTPDDAIALTNANPYGNGTGIFTQLPQPASSRTKSTSARWGSMPIPVPQPYFSFTGSRLQAGRPGPVWGSR